MVDEYKLTTDAAYREDMRHRFVTDLWFACELLGFPLHPVLHKPVVELYFGKNNALPIGDQHPIHNRMHLDPRFTFKTTVGRVDKVQWICAFPEEVTILNQTATQPLGQAISKAIADFFYKPKFEKPTPFQMMFPELVVDKEPFSRGEDTWNTPVRKRGQLDSTLAYTSPQSVQSGWHPTILNCDDMVETKNSGIRASNEVRQGVIATYETNKNTRPGWGYTYLIGTRYHPFDLYGSILQTMNETRWKKLVRESVTRKDGQRLLPGEFPPENELILHFAELPGLDYDGLQEKFLDYESFMCQQQNDPQGGHTPTFDDRLYESCETDAERVPLFGGEVFTCWRLPYGSKPETNRYVEGAAARIVDNKVYVIDCWRYGGTPSHQAEMMVQANRKIGGEGMIVKQTPGYEGFATLLRNEMNRKNASLKLQFAYWESDENYKASGVKQMEPLLKVGRILFARGMTRGADCRKQFVHYGLVEETGILECVQTLADRIPLSQMRANMEEEELEWHRRRREDAMLQSFLAQQGMPVVDEELRRKTAAHLAAMEAASNSRFGMLPLPGGLDG